MAIRVEVDGPLQRRVGSAPLECSGKTLEEVLKDIDRQFPGFYGDVVSQSKNDIRDIIIVSVNDEQVWSMNRELSDGDEVFIGVLRVGG